MQLIRVQLDVEKEPLAFPLVGLRKREHVHGQWQVDTVDAAEDLSVLSRFVVEEAGFSKLKADCPDQVVASNELSIAGRRYLQSLQAGEKLYSKGV
jgi:hypothetical protein